MPNPRRLCMVVHASYPLDVRVAREVRVALREGYEVDVLAMTEPGEPKREVVGGANVYRLPFAHRRGMGMVGVVWEYVGFTLLASAQLFWRVIRRRYGIVQIHNPPDFLIVAAIAPRLLGARVILDIHDLSPDMFAMRFDGRPGARLADRGLRLVERLATRFADVVITVHEPYRRELEKRGVPRAKTAVVMNSFDEGLLPEQTTDGDSDAFRIVYHGTITPPYGVVLLVEAVARLTDEIDGLRLEIDGEGDSLPAIRAQAQRLGIEDRLRLSGRYLPHAEVLARVASAQVGVIPNLPTRLNTFALSSKLFEYVALGVPVVCADLPTMVEHFTEDEVLFFRAGDSQSLADALREVARDPVAAAARAQAALARYRETYSWAANATRYARVLEQLAARRGIQEE
jgi:glycosyltransferase involved in cell wall biosynthesis